MPNYVPIQDLTRQVELTDQMIIPISDGEESFAVTVEAFKFFVEANAEGMQAVVDAIDALKAAVGSPLVANTAAEMMDEEKVYVYTGSETGYTSGYWYYFDGSAWQPGGVYNAAAVQTDKDLAVADQAADAKATGEAVKAEANTRNSLSRTLLEPNIEGYNADSISENKTISSTGTVFNKNGRLLTGGLNGASWPHVDGVSLNIAGVKLRIHGYKAVLNRSSSTYLGVTDWSNADGTVIPKAGENWKGIIVEIAHSDVNSTTVFTSEEIAAIAEGLVFYKQKVGKLSDYVISESKYTGLFPIIWQDGYIDTSTGKDNTGVAFKYGVACFDYIPVTPSEILSYLRPTTGFLAVVFEYDEEQNFLRYNTLRAADTKYEVGNDAYFVRFALHFSDYTNEMTPRFAYEHLLIYRTQAVLSGNGTVIPLGLHTMPENTGVLNAIKNARQFTDVRWNPAVSIPRVSVMDGESYEDEGYSHTYVDDVFSAGTEYNGIPYSLSSSLSPRNLGGFVGIERSIENFVTSAYNASSKLSTDSEKYDQNTAAFYGGVCVHIVCHALGLPNVESPSFHLIPGMTKKFDVSDGDISTIKLCDVLIQTGHVAIITDIVRDNLGITNIEVSELTKFGLKNKDIQATQYGGKARRKMWTVEDFITYFESFGVYNYEYIANTKYNPTPYSPMVDEGETYPMLHLPVMPDMGNAVYYKSQDSNIGVKLLIASTGWTNLVVQKNGAAFGNYDVSGSEDYTVTCDPDDAIYTAYLTKTVGSNSYRTAECTWLVLGKNKDVTMVTDEVGDNIVASVTLKRRSRLVKPAYVVFGNYSGGKIGKVYDLTIGTTADGNGYYSYSFKANLPSGLISFSSYHLFTNTERFGNPTYLSYSYSS